MPRNAKHHEIENPPLTSLPENEQAQTLVALQREISRTGEFWVAVSLFPIKNKLEHFLENPFDGSSGLRWNAAEAAASGFITPSLCLERLASLIDQGNLPLLP